MTDADNGAYALADDQFFNVPAQTVTQKPIERTGAGDAFASAFLTAHLFADKDTEEALTWGTINAAAVIQQIGPHAGLLSQEEIVNRLQFTVSRQQEDRNKG